MKSTTWFTGFTKATAKVTGHSATFMAAVILLLVWGISGFVFGSSET